MSLNALNISWTYGMRKDVIGGVHSLSTDSRNALFYLSSHSGVIYDFEQRSQMILQGHCNLISCCSVSADKRWIITADVGDDPILVVWDSATGSPVKTLFGPHAKGVISMDMSSDSLFIVTLGGISNEGTQDIALWAWTNDDEIPVLRQEIHITEFQHEVKFDPKNQSFLLTTGASTVCFWNWRDYTLEGYSAKVSKSDFGHFSGSFTCTIFLAGTANALTSTSDGYVIFWEAQASTLPTGSKQGLIRSASKVLRLVECGIQTMATTENNYLAIACTDGAIRFYDYFLRLEAWFEDLAAGPITSMSFGLQKNPFAEGEGGAPGLRFWVPDFIVGTSDAFIVGIESSIFDAVQPEDRRGTLLMQGMADEVTCIACHPSRSQVAFTCHNGTLQVWDYELKLLMNIREFNSAHTHQSFGHAKTTVDMKHFLRPMCAAFEPRGEFIAIGFSTGVVKFLGANSFDDMTTFAPSADAILSLKFCASGKYLAGFDKSHHVMLFSRGGDGEVAIGAPAPDEYVYIGRIKSHGKPIIGIEFGFREGNDVLVSVGEDRRCVEYDLEASSVSSGIVCVAAPGQRPGKIIEQSCQPTAVMWFPHVEGDVEDRFVVANDGFKLKEYNVDSKQCRRTSLAPTFGGPPTNLCQLRKQGAVNFFAYSTASKVIGLGCFPLTGDPSKVMGLVAHPSQISGLAVSHDGNYVFSSGGKDLSVNMWNVDTAALIPPHYNEDPTDIESYLSLLEGGNGGELHNDIVDYFYYCQIKSQGEDSMESRDISGFIPLDEIAALMRAIGYYPSEEEILNMINEVRFRVFMNTGETVERIGLIDFIKLYINHRPVLPLSSKSIQESFSTICASLGSQSIDSSLLWDELRRVMMSEGEAMTQAEMDTYLAALIGGPASSTIADDYSLDPKTFSSEILGFENS